MLSRTLIRRAGVLFLVLLFLAMLVSVCIGRRRVVVYYHVLTLRVDNSPSSRFKTLEKLAGLGQETSVPANTLASLGLGRYRLAMSWRLTQSLLIAKLFDEKENELVYILLEQCEDGSFREVVKCGKSLG